MTVEVVARWQPSEFLGEQIALVVEDDPRLQRAMTKELARGHFTVLSANCYEAAIAHLKRRTVDIVCIDIGLPNESGYELCEYIRGTLGLMRAPIIATSEHGTSLDLAHAEDARANAFLVKPFSMGQLSQCVQSLLDPSPHRTLPRHELAARYEEARDGSAQPAHLHLVSTAA